MKNNKNFLLIEGSFNPLEAKEILLRVFGDKIQFHQKKNFSSKERLGKEDINSLERIPQLQKSICDIIISIDEAQQENMIVTIHSEVIISFTKIETK